jgi:hypothetical protein
MPLQPCSVAAPHGDLPAADQDGSDIRDAIEWHEPYHLAYSAEWPTAGALMTNSHRSEGINAREIFLQNFFSKIFAQSCAALHGTGLGGDRPLGLRHPLELPPSSLTTVSWPVAKMVAAVYPPRSPHGIPLRFSANPAGRAGERLMWRATPRPWPSAPFSRSAPQRSHEPR